MTNEGKVPVLMVDDRPENLSSLEALLEDMELQLVKAYSGNDALREVLYTDFALVLMDVQMPEMDGFETAELMRRNVRTREIPIIFVSAGKEQHHLFKGYDAGAVDYLMKPIEPAFLRSKVRVFCELYRKRRLLEVQEQRLEALVAQRTADLSKTAQQLRESKERYRRLLESVTSYVYTVTFKDGRPVKTLHNDACQSVTGYSADQCQSDDELWARITVPEDRPLLEGAIRRLLAEKKPVTLEYRILHRDGSLRWIVNTMVPSLGGDGELISYDGIVVDVTERRRLEEQLTQSQKMESVGRLAGGVAHEFNNMLSVILGSTELLKLDIPEEDRRYKLLEQIGKAAERSSELTRQLLAFSRRDVVSPKAVNLNAQVLEAEKMLRLLMGETVNLSFRPAAGLWTVRIDPVQVDQMLMNLAANARDAMPDGGALTVGLANVRVGEEYSHYRLDARPGEYVQVTVSDTGMGMDQQTREHIFEPFFTTKKVGKGTGLGLAILYGIVAQNKGFVEVQSEPGCGTTFRIYLPRFHEESPDYDPLPLLEAASGEGTILLVEDEAMLLEVVTKQLEEIGYTVIKAASAKDALSIQEENGEIDLLLTDVVMPEMKGPELVQRMRQRSPHLKVLFMSGYAADSGVQQALEGDTQYIQKPLNMKDLARTIKDILQQ